MIGSLDFVKKLSNQVSENFIAAVYELYCQAALKGKVIALSVARGILWMPAYVCRAIHSATEPGTQEKANASVSRCARVVARRTALSEGIRHCNKELAERRPKLWPALREAAGTLVAILMAVSGPTVYAEQKLRASPKTETTTPPIFVDGQLRDEFKKHVIEVTQHFASVNVAVTAISEAVASVGRESQKQDARLLLVEKDVQSFRDSFLLTPKDLADFRLALLTIVLASKTPPVTVLRECEATKSPVAVIGFKTRESEILDNLVTASSDGGRSNETELKQLERFVQARAVSNWMLIEGQASHKGDTPYNAGLSARRAEAILDRVARRYPLDDRPRQLRNVTILPLGETFAVGENRDEDRVVKIWDCGAVEAWSCVCGSLTSRLAAR